MICERCGSYLPDEAILCNTCGAMMHRTTQTRDEGVRAIRQGRRMAVPAPLPDQMRGDVPVYGDYDMSPLPVEQERGVRRSKPPKAPTASLDAFASRPNTRRGVPVRGNIRTRQVVSKHGKAHVVSGRPINWMRIGVIFAVLLLAAAIGYMLYMRTSDTGQRTTARKRVVTANAGMLTLATSTDPLLDVEKQALLKDWSDAPAQAYWLVGQEYMDMGDMPDAVMAFQIANILQPNNYDGLLLLGSAYELNNEDAQAEALYRQMLETVSPSRPEAYTALINMLLNQDRRPEAADLMLLAFTNTDRENFRQQRRDFIPNTPQVDTDHLSGRYELEQHITVTSPQGYDVYYTLDDAAELPEGGTLLTDGTVTIPEGTFTLRAVCVVEDLVSDEMHASYTVYYPTPAAPKCNLAPNTYSSLREVSLRPGEALNAKEARKGKTKEQLAVEDDQTFYYTIDGSLPDPAISPVYTGPIKLPSGRVTLRAVAVNGYGKQSSTMEVGYKFDVKPHPLEVYSETDVFSGFKLNDTTLEAFTAAFGQPKSTVPTTYLTLDAQAQHLEYGWGYAVFALTGGQWSLVRVEMTGAIAGGPRGVGIGSSEADITGVYKDFGMPQNQDTSRNLYYADPQIGVVLANEDGTRTVQYTCRTLGGKTWVLQYHLKNGRCVKIVNYFKP
ncbi:MAG: chitobiase/beta-hexosaminidase C-terminal domain-containing protein [Candidatus Limiplasma sp.]|nr:chitobiase/beta-hexosaminidase C-terminal domain-containing protein [Candidatus Limiplasma sp.]